MTMDLKEIIKWFIPCFHILLFLNKKMYVRMTFCLFLFFNLCLVNGATVNKELGVSERIDNAKNIVNYDNKFSFNQSVVNDVFEEKGLIEDESTGRTFGRPFKKMVGSLMPLIFQIGAASTWAVVAAVVGVKTLLVTLLILKLLLVAGAAKFGALFASKGQQSHGHGWEPHQKEIHLHIHNGQVSHEHDEHSIVPWSRDSSQQTDKNYNIYMEPYVASGPQTISTPFGNYVKIGSRNLRKK
ncbi:uncharacterized protein LOC128681579 [Plodia interpunctella]|uniref:uncharacterized protein LOC128681579 n=1 Tax=Plodia interpunctella TaxID=58824 RepID=UPI002368C155|nr:uncharacterized protein LOC128681579 [Plodia interpunctella]